VSEKFASMQGLLDATVASARRISSDLRPLMLDDLGHTAAAEWMVQNFSSRTGIACDLELGRGDLDLPDPYATTVFRVLQESLTNAAKHAQATRVDVSLEREGPEIVLAVSDDGRGFEPAAPVRPNAFGLVGLRERALLVGGEISIDSAPGRGTRVELRVPVKEAA
jgi:signal transduction histidine kinase